MHANFKLHHLSKVLSGSLGRPVQINGIKPVGGGSISRTFKLSSTNESFFLKINSGHDALTMFKAEVAGLKLLNEKSSFPIPKTISLSEVDGEVFLIMEMIDAAPRSNNYWADLAIDLAELHKNSYTRFGLAQNNFIGSLPQQNNFETSWASFFINQRIHPMLKRGSENNLLSKDERLSIESMLSTITNLMPIEVPALLHGDLWSGNLMVDAQGRPTLIDPAVYYGHREMDIAFTHLFGGFSREFYHVYQEIFPLEPGFNQRIDLYNLYPLLVHLNLFGRSYYSQIKSIINQFT